MPYHIVAWEDATDLRKVSPGIHFLRAMARKFQLGEDGDTVVFVNAKVNRFRLVQLMGKVPVLVIMPRAESARLLTSVALEVALALGDMAQESRSMGGSSSAACQSATEAAARLMLRQKRQEKRGLRVSRRPKLKVLAGGAA